MRGRSLLSILSLALALAPGAAARQSDEVRLGAALVDIRAVVTDASGRPVADLTKDDFEVLDAGAPQQVEHFSVERLGAAPQTAGSAQGGRPHAAAPPARAIALVVDTLNLSAGSLARVRAALGRFVDEQMSDRDFVMLVTTTGSVAVGGQFGRDRAVLHKLVDRLRPEARAGKAPFTPHLAARIARGDADALNLGLEILSAEEAAGASAGSLNQGGGAAAVARTYRARAMTTAVQVLGDAEARRNAALATLDSVADQLSGLPGQRLVALYSDGFSLWTTSGERSTRDLREATGRAARHGVVVNAILTGGAEDTAENAIRFAPDPTYNAELTRGRDDLEDGLDAVARDTGGEYFRNANDLSAPLADVLRHNDAYYSLAYYLPEGAGDGYREVSVRVKSHPEYTVRAQRGYLPVEAKRAEPARDPRERFAKALAAALPAADIAVTVEVERAKVDAGKLELSLKAHIDGRALRFEERDGKYPLSLEVATVVYDMNGKPVYQKVEPVGGELLAAGVEAAREKGFRYVAKIDALPPGLYQARVGVREVGPERLGVAVVWVDGTAN